MPRESRRSSVGVLPNFYPSGLLTAHGTATRATLVLSLFTSSGPLPTQFGVQTLKATSGATVNRQSNGINPAWITVVHICPGRTMGLVFTSLYCSPSFRSIRPRGCRSGTDPYRDSRGVPAASRRHQSPCDIVGAPSPWHRGVHTQ